MAETPLGRFCWFDLMTTDPDAAPDFYAQVTGWGTAPFEGGAEPYTMWTNGEAPLGGVMQLPAEAAAAGAPPHWLAYLSTPDIEATVAKATELGGTIITEMDIPDVGSIAVIADPRSAVFGVYQPTDQAPGHDADASVGEFSWHELATDGWQAAWAFYSSLFGWQETDQMDMGEAGIYQMYGAGGRPLGGIYDRPAELPVPAWLHYVRVADVAAAAETVKALGGTVRNGPMEVPGGDIVAQCLDPQGAAFALHSTPDA